MHSASSDMSYGLERKQQSIYSLYPGRSSKNLPLSDYAAVASSVQELWFPRPKRWCQCIDESVAFSHDLVKKPQRFLSDRLWLRTVIESGHAELANLDCAQIDRWVRTREYKHHIGPSTGLSTLVMALDLFPRATFFLAGFSGEPAGGWYWGPNSDPSPRHPWAWERCKLTEILAQANVRLFE